VHALAKAVILLALTTAADAAGFLFVGTFPTDDQVQLFRFTVNTAAVVTLQSYGYAGGVVNSTTIPAGGLVPYAMVFSLVGSDYVQSLSDNGGHCPTTQQDSVTHNCDDPFIQATLAAGVYYLALSVWDNVASTGSLADGFRQTGNPGFTCAEGSVSGQFCDVTDAFYRPRTGDWAFAFTGMDSVTAQSTPEPSTWWPTLSGGLLGALVLRRKIF
jgi:hypothetical protein